MRHTNDDLRHEEYLALEAAERTIDRYCESLILPAAALATIHTGMLWRCVADNWDEYLRSRFRLSPRHAAYVQVRANIDAPGAIERTAVPPMAFASELDDVSNAIADAQIREGTMAWVALQRAEAHLREARSIVERELLPLMPGPIDSWFERLKSLVTELRKAANEPDHSDSDSDSDSDSTRVGNGHDPGISRRGGRVGRRTRTA